MTFEESAVLGVEFWLTFWVLVGLESAGLEEVLEAAMAEYDGLAVLAVGAVEVLEDAEVVERVEELLSGTRGFGAEASVVPLLVRRWPSSSGLWGVSDRGGGDFLGGWDGDGPSASLSLEKPAPKLMWNWSDEMDLVQSGSVRFAITEKARWLEFTTGGLGACMASRQGNCS